MARVMDSAEKDYLLNKFVETCKKIGGEIPFRSGGFGRDVACKVEDREGNITQVKLVVPDGPKNPRIHMTSTAATTTTVKDLHLIGSVHRPSPQVPKMLIQDQHDTQIEIAPNAGTVIEVGGD